MEHRGVRSLEHVMRNKVVIAGNTLIEVYVNNTSEGIRKGHLLSILVLEQNGSSTDILAHQNLGIAVIGTCTEKVSVCVMKAVCRAYPPNIAVRRKYCCIGNENVLGGCMKWMLPSPPLAPKSNTTEGCFSKCLESLL